MFELSHTNWLFFDMGYTLINEDCAHRKRIEEVISSEKEQGQVLTFDAIYDEMIRASKEFRQPFPTAMDKLGIKERPKYCKELEAPYEDAGSVLKELKKRYSIGIIANQTPGSEKRLSDFGLSPYIDICIASAEAGVSKPDPRIFQLALEQARCLPENACMIGDRLDNDTYPAKKLGMKTIWIKQGFGAMQTPSSKEYEPDCTISNLIELLSIL